MKRRAAIGVLGGVAAGPLVTSPGAFAHLVAWSERVRAATERRGATDGPTTRAVSLLTPPRARIMAALAEVIIPATDTPGASDAGTTDFVAALVDGWLDEDDRDRFLDRLDAVDPAALERFGTIFADCAPGEQAAFVRDLDDELARLREDPAVDETRHFFHDVKRFTLTAYFTSDVGLDALGHRTTFRAFEGCAPVNAAAGDGLHETGDAHAPGPEDARWTIPRRALFHIRPRPRDYDAVVVGSGMSGGWAAKELAELGANVLVLEAGPRIVPERDYAEHVRTSEMPYRGWNDRKALAAEQPVQRQCYACDEVARKFFVNDNENPYTTDPEKPFLWIRGRQVGGRSIMWARQCYRLGDLDFEANARDGHGTDWPIRYADLAPWYDHVEAFVGISGRAEGLPQLPDGVFLPPMEMSCVEEHVRDSIAGAFGGRRTMTIGRTAVLTRDHRGRRACHYCGPCHRGCRTRSYFSSVTATLPAAEATGRMTLRPNSIVPEVVWDPARGRVTGVRVIDAESHEDMEIRARTVFLAASALESTRILLNSRSSDFPDGLANSSGVLGKYLMDHTMCDDTHARFDGWEDMTTRGRRPNGIYIPRFRNVTEPAASFVRGYGFQGSATRTGWDRGMSMPGFGAEFKNDLMRPGAWEFRLHAFGECLPREENHVALDPEQVDAWGIPTLRISCAWGDNERAMMKDAVEQAGEMLDAAGGRDIELQTQIAPPGLAIHEMGTARMGRDPATSVLNAHNQAWDIPNLFVVDGAAMASSGCQNPSLTYMALAARASHYAVWAARRGEV